MAFNVQACSCILLKRKKIIQKIMLFQLLLSKRRIFKNFNSEMWRHGSFDKSLTYNNQVLITNRSFIASHLRGAKPKAAEYSQFPL